ncbi:MAG: hypothetical protein ACRDAM_20540 [Casimicrobium sp.]
MSQPDDMTPEMRRTITLGMDADAFLSTNVGRALIARAESQIQAAMEELIEVSPTNTETIRKLQFEAQLGHRFQLWLRDMIQEGQNAENQYRSQSDDVTGS